MFNFGNKQDNITIIARGTRFEGALQSDSGVFVEGTHVTSTLNDSSVQVSESGYLELAEKLIANTVEISGTVKGNIYADIIKINKGAKVDGDIVYKSLTCNGGFIDGTLSYNAPKDIIND